MTDQHPRDDEIAGRLRAHESRVPVAGGPAFLARTPRGWHIPAAAAVLVVAGAFLIQSALPPTAAEPSPEPSSPPSDTETATPSATSSPTLTPEPSATPSPEPEPAGPFAVQWSSVELPGSAVAIQSILTFDGRLIATGRDGVEAAAWISSDGGATWRRASVESTRAADERTSFGDVVAIDDALVGVGWWGALGSDQFAWMTWRSTDGGLTWREHRDESLPYALRIATEWDGTVVGIGWRYAGTTPFGSFVSRSGDGLTWQTVNPEGWEQSQVNAITTAGDRLVAVGSRWYESFESLPVVWLSDDGGATWRTIAMTPFSGAPHGFAQDVVVLHDGSIVVVGASQERSESGSVRTSVPTAWISTDHGETWRTENMGTRGAATDVAAADRGLVAIGSTNLFNPGEVSVYTSADGILWGTVESITDADAWVLTAEPVGSRVAVGISCDSGDTCPAPLVFGTVRELER